MEDIEQTVMSIVTLQKWHNSARILIPAEDIKTARAYIGKKFKIIGKPNGCIVLQPIDESRADGLKFFNNTFDENEWTW